MSKARAVRFVDEGIVVAKAGEFLRARHAFRNAIEIDPHNVSAWVWSSAVAENPVDAVRALEKAIQLDPNNVAAKAALKVGRFEAGVAAARAGNRPAARFWLAKACAEDPANEAAWLWLAGVTDDPATAIGFLERALKLNPANEQARVGIERFREILASPWCCAICLARSNAEFTTCPNCRAILDFGRGDLAIGNPCPDFDKIERGAARLLAEVRAKPDFANQYYLGMALLNLGKPEKALAHFRSAQALNANDRAFASQVDLLDRALTEASRPPGRMGPMNLEMPSRNNRTILVVDDSTTVRKLVWMTMQRTGVRVLEAHDGQAALEVIEREGNPDMLLVDVMMPGMDGFALCRTIRNNPVTARIPVVMLTARDGFLDKIRGRMAGTDGFVTKPFQPTELVQVVREFCAAAAD